MKDLLLRACVVVITSKMNISRGRLADYVKTFHQKACRTCCTIIVLNSTNQIIDLRRCLCRSRRCFLNTALARSVRGWFFARTGRAKIIPRNT